MLQKNKRPVIDFTKQINNIKNDIVNEAQNALNKLPEDNKNNLMKTPSDSLNDLIKNVNQTKTSPLASNNPLNNRLKDRLMLYRLLKGHLEGQSVKELLRKNEITTLPLSQINNINIDEFNYDINENINISIFKIISRRYLQYESKLIVVPNN